MTGKKETVDLQLGRYQVRVYRLDQILQNRPDSPEKARLLQLLGESNEAEVVLPAFPANLVGAYSDLISVSSPVVTPRQDTPPKPSGSTSVQGTQGGENQSKEIPSEKDEISWWEKIPWWL
jgi:hypothetical protein